MVSFRTSTPRRLINGVNVQFSQVSSPNMWLGVSQWNDPPLNGSI
jgi:hypothetical protein